MWPNKQFTLARKAFKIIYFILLLKILSEPLILMWGISSTT